MTNKEAYEILLTLKSALEKKESQEAGVSLYVEAHECALRALLFCCCFDEMSQRLKEGIQHDD